MDSDWLSKILGSASSDWAQKLPDEAIQIFEPWPRRFVGGVILGVIHGILSRCAVALFSYLFHIDNRWHIFLLIVLQAALVYQTPILRELAELAVKELEQDQPVLENSGSLLSWAPAFIAYPAGCLVGHISLPTLFTILGAFLYLSPPNQAEIVEVVQTIVTISLKTVSYGGAVYRNLCQKAARSFLAPIPEGAPFPHSTFRYQRVPPRHFRLLKIEPCLYGMRIKLITEALDSAPPFEAMSYTWGGSEMTTHRLTINGKSLLITRTAADILSQRASLLRSQLLWIDAICID